MRNKYIDLAINKLGIAFDSLDLTFHQMDTGVPGDVTRASGPTGKIPDRAAAS